MDNSFIGRINKENEKMEGTRGPICKSLTARGQNDLHSGLQLVNVKQSLGDDKKK